MNDVQLSTPSARESRQAQGPRGKYFLGSTLDFQRDALGFVTRMARDYGEIAHFRLGNIEIYQVNDPDAIQQVLQSKNHNYIKGEFFGTLRMMAGNGLIVSEGTHWLRQRRLMQPAFHRQRIAGFAGMMVEQAQEMLQGWEEAARSKQHLNVARSFTDLTMAIITRAMFTNAYSDRTHRVGEAISHLLEDVNFRFVVPFYPRLNVPTPRNLKARASIRIVDEVVYSFIHERRASGQNGDDLLGMLMSARDADTGEAMTDEQLRDEVLTVFVAGHETTAVLLAWVCYLLALHPEAAEQMYAEVDQVLGQRPPTLEDLPKLTFTRMVLDETMRLYPPAWVTNREAVEDDVLCGVRIPAGKVVLLSSYAVHRLPQYWEDPEAFDPLRFTAERSTQRPRFAYFPFGGGPHQCIGNSFALTEASLIMASIAQRCRLELIPGQAVIPQPAVTLRPKNGLMMAVKKR
jgi:cytochrome P450